MDADIKIMRAKAKLILDFPFFGTLCAGMFFVEDKSCQGVWTDGKKAGYNPFYIESSRFDEVVGMTAHIVLHRALGHHRRVSSRDFMLWNTACDYSINWILADSGFTLPEGHLLREDLKGLSAEEIYLVLLAEKDENKGESKEKKNKNKEIASVDSELNSSSSESEPEEGLDQEIKSSRDNPDDENDGADGTQKENKKSKLPQLSGEVREPEIDSSPDSNEIKPDILLHQAFNSALNEGKIPGSLKRAVENYINPVLDWKELLSRFIEKSGKSDYTWTSPNKRLVSMGIYLPGIKSEKAENIVIAIDTSGSISEEEIKIFNSELKAALSSFDGRITLLGCDTEVNLAMEISSWEIPEKIQFTGGGGTDFRPPFEWAEKNLSFVRCLFYLTDLNSSRYPEEPYYPVLWITTNRHYMKKPPFGEIINI